jgi:carbonic anhydrase
MKNLRSMPWLYLMIISLVLGGLSACRAAGPTPTSTTVHWGYAGEVAPEHWGELSPDYAACSHGKEQSPVDIPASAPVNPATLQIEYLPSALYILNNGHSIQVNYDSGSTLEIDGIRYPLVQFHLHSLSEHTLAGSHTPMELHLVHTDDAGRMAVVGVMIVEGAPNPAYEAILSHLPAEEGQHQAFPEVVVNAGALLPVERSYYRYAGSLTTPPCTEDVSWIVMAAPVELSTEQIAAFQELYTDNYRPVQPLNARQFLANTP